MKDNLSLLLIQYLLSSNNFSSSLSSATLILPYNLLGFESELSLMNFSLTTKENAFLLPTELSNDNFALSLSNLIDEQEENNKIEMIKRIFWKNTGNNFSD